MIKGNIKTVDVIIHPITIAHQFGLMIAARAILCALSPYSYTFLDVVGASSIADLNKRRLAAFPKTCH